MGKSIFRNFVEFAMECMMQQTKEKYNRLAKLPVSLVTIVFIAQLRDEYNNFMNDCNRLLKAEETYRQTQFN